MASITTPTSSFTCVGLVQKRPISLASAPIGLRSIAAKGKVRCSKDVKPSGHKNESEHGMGASLMAAATTYAASSPAAMALVDERLSTEGTGLPFGLSNNLLGWILFGVFGVIWTLYFTYTSSLEEDEESGLSL